MAKISQKERYRQSLIKYAMKHGVTKAAIKYETNRQYVYRWMKRYDCSLESMKDRYYNLRHISSVTGGLLPLVFIERFLCAACRAAA